MSERRSDRFDGSLSGPRRAHAAEPAQLHPGTAASAKRTKKVTDVRTWVEAGYREPPTKRSTHARSVRVATRLVRGHDAGAARTPGELDHAAARPRARARRFGTAAVDLVGHAAARLLV